MDEWEQFESGSYDGGYDDLSSGGESDVDNNLDWQDSLGTSGDLADQWLASQGEAEFNDPDSHLVGMDTEAAILNARLRSTGLPITASNQIGVVPEHMRPSDVTHYDLSGLDPAQRNIDNLTRGNVMQGNISTIETNDVTHQQQRQFEKITNASLKGESFSSDALPMIQGHADNLTQESFSIGGRSVDQVLYSLAGQYLKEGVNPNMQKNLAQQLGIQIPRTSRGMQASFGGESMVSHMDALPTPMQLPSRFQGLLRPTLNTSGGVYDPAYTESREYRFASQADKASMDYFNKPSAVSSLTGAAYVGMHKTPEQLAKLNPMQQAALESQKDIEADFKGFLSLSGLAKDIKGRKLSADNSQGTATNFIRPVVGTEYYGTSNLNELAAHGLMDEAGFMGEGGQEGQMSALGNYADMITGGINPVDFNNPFTSESIAEALGETSVEEQVKADLRAGKTFNTKTPKVDMVQPSGSFEEAVAKAAPTPTMASVANAQNDVVPIESDARKTARENAQANVEARLRSQGLNISSAEQGSEEWLRDRTNILTSTGIATSMSEPLYGDTWLGHLRSSINEKNNPEQAGRRSNPIFDAGTRGEELGKQWFEQKFDKTIVDLGLITDPNRPNQGTSVDGVVTSRSGEIGDNLELSEFKWGTTRFPPRDAAKKHQQQLQHQMYMTGAESVNLVTGYDPNAGTPRAGDESQYSFSNEPVFRDPDWAKNNADFIQARANEKASAVGAGSTEGIKEGYIAALRERYPDESDKGLTRAEKAAKKQEESEAKEQEKQDRVERKEFHQNIKAATTFLGKGASGGINLQSSVDYLGSGRFGMAGQAASAIIGIGGAAYDTARGVNNLVGDAADAGAESTQAFYASDVALKSLSFSDQQAASMNQDTYSAQAMASMGEFDPLIKKLTAYRGLVTMDELRNLSPEQRTILTRNRAQQQGISNQQLAGMAMVAGDSGMARDFQTDSQEQDILATAEARGEAGLKEEGSLRANVGTMNVEAVSLNTKDVAKEALLSSGADASMGGRLASSMQQAMQEFREDPWYKSVGDVATFAPRKLIESLGAGFGQDWQMSFGGKAASDIASRGGERITVNVDSSITDERTQTTVDTNLNDEPIQRTTTVAKDE